MRTNELRKLIKTQLTTLKTSGDVTEVYYKTAADNAMYPHIVFNLSQIGVLQDDLNRKDYILEIDVWDNGLSESKVFDVSDSIEDLLHTQSLPQTNILPVFFFESRQSILDEDKRIKHELIKFTVQLYTK